MDTPAHPEDLELARAALAGDRAALTAIERTLSDVVDAALAKMGAAPDVRREIAQRLAAHLLVAEEDGEARLADYQGRGPLRGWLRAAAIRTYLNTVRGVRREVGDDAMVDRMADGAADTELAVLRATYKADFERTFSAAVAELGDRERTALRMTYLDGVRLEEIAALFAISRATAHRLLTRARDELAAAVESKLRTELGLSETEFHSVRRLIQSQLEISLRGVFRQAPPIPP